MKERWRRWVSSSSSTSVIDSSGVGLKVIDDKSHTKGPQWTCGKRLHETSIWYHFRLFQAPLWHQPSRVPVWRTPRPTLALSGLLIPHHFNRRHCRRPTSPNPTRIDSKSSNPHWVYIFPHVIWRSDNLKRIRLLGNQTYAIDTYPSTDWKQKANFCGTLWTLRCPLTWVNCVLLTLSKAKTNP